MLVYNRSLHYGDCNSVTFLVVAVARFRFLIFVLKFKFCYLCHPFQVYNRCHPSHSSHAHLPGLLALVHAQHDARRYLSIIGNIRSVSLFFSSFYPYRDCFVYKSSVTPINYNIMILIFTFSSDACMHDLDAAYGHLNKREGTCALYTRATHSIVAVERLRSGEDRRTRTTSGSAKPRYITLLKHFLSGVGTLGFWT